MNRIITILIITISTISVFSQNFEGKITYLNTYKSQTEQITDQQWQSMMGETQEYFIKNGNYKSVTNGTLMQWQIYVNSDNKLYSKMANSEAALWNNGLINVDSVLDIKLNKNVIKVLGYNCDELILTCKSGIQKYYFNTALRVNAALFENHKFGNWYAFLKESNSLPLKITMSNAQFTMESIATEIEKIKISDSDLKLPEGIKTVKSPY